MIFICSLLPSNFLLNYLRVSKLYCLLSLRNQTKLYYVIIVYHSIILSLNRPNYQNKGTLTNFQRTTTLPLAVY
jgi:hypothetical protein